MKKICFLGFSLFTVGGAQRVTLSLANDLSEYYETHILSVCEIPEENRNWANSKVNVCSLGMKKDIRAKESLKLFFKVKKYLEKNHIDILFVVGSLPVPLVCILRPFLKLKVVFCEHENLHGRDKKSILFRKLAAKISNRIVVLTQTTLNDYIKITKVNRNKLTLIYNYIDENLLNSPIEYNINSKKIISVGRLSPEKGFDMAIEVAKLVFEKHPSWSWDIYGEGPERAKLEDKINKLGLENKFVLKGETKEIMQKYRDYAIYVLPSYREGFAVVLIEAKSQNLPVVSFKCDSGPGEIVNDETDGYLIPCYDKVEMANKICYLIENPEKRMQFSEKARGNIDKFTKINVLSKWKKLIERV